MWFWLALAALLFWSGSDLFSKIGCRDGSDKLNHLKMVIAVGIVMGLHAVYEIFVNGEKEDRRGRKLYEKDLIKINDEVYQICR